MCFHTDSVDAGVGPATGGQLLERFVDVMAFIVDRLIRAAFSLPAAAALASGRSR